MLTCRICDLQDDTVARYIAKGSMVLCPTCCAETPDKVSRLEFDKLYWDGDSESVAPAMRKSFYEDYLMSNMTLGDYVRATTGKEMTEMDINAFDTIRASEQDNKYEYAEDILIKDLADASGLLPAEIAALLGDEFMYDEAIDRIQDIAEALADTIRAAKLWRALPQRVKNEWGG